MNFYTSTDYEKQLQESSHNIQILPLLEKKSITRLQIIYVKDKNYVKSISDQYCNLRMILFSFLVKMHYSYNSENQKRLDKFKKFVYEAKLQKLTKNRGLQRQQLFKNVAINLKKIPLGQQCQATILHLFNMVSYFDQVLMRSLAEKFQSESIINDIDYITKFLRDQLGLTIIWTDQDVRFQNTNDIFLKTKDNNILRYSIGKSCNLESDIQSLMSSQTPNQVQKLKLLQTISMSGSPSVNVNSPIPKEQQTVNRKNYDSGKMKKSAIMQKQNSSNFWACFCCKSFD